MAGMIICPGEWLTEPVAIEPRIPQYHDLVALPNGDVTWLIARDEDQEVTLVRVRSQ